MSRSIRLARQGAPPAVALPLGLERVAVTTFVAFALLVGVLIPPSAFADGRNWSLSRTPASVTGGAPAAVQVTARNTGDDGGGEAVGCVIIAIPASAFTVTNVVIDSVSDTGDDWSASFSGDGTWWYASLISDSGGGNRLHEFESVTATVTFNDTGSDGTFTWTGNAFNKDDCTDSFFMPRTVNVTIDGAAVNNPPVAQPDAYGTGRNAPLTVGAPGVLANDADADGDPLTAVQTSAPANGGVVWGADGSFTYTPDPGFVGDDSFTYRADDASAPSADATVTITVANSAPMPSDDAYSTGWAQPLVVAAPGILDNDSDPDGDFLTASVISGPSDGSLVPNADGSFTYVPDPLFVGSDSFVYAASDGIASVPATVVINVGNTAPVASDDGPYAATEDTTLAVAAPGVLANDSDADGNPLTAALVADATNGTVTIRADGSFDYEPDAEFSGADAFTYQVSDGVASDTATVTLTVTATNDDPIARNDTATTSYATPIVIDVLANDSDADGDNLSVIAVAPPSRGTASIVSDRIRYTPPAGFSGSTTFLYTVSDGAATDTATITVTVGAAPPSPTPAATAEPVPTAASTPMPAASRPPDPTPAILPTASPSETPLETESPAPSVSPTPSPTPSPSAPTPGPSAGSGGDGDTLAPLAQPQVTTSFGSPGGDFALAALFQGFGGSFAWAMPAAILGVPGALFILAVAGQLLGAAAWIPTVRRMLAGVGVRRRRRSESVT